MCWLLFCEFHMCWFVFVVVCALLNKFPYKSFPEFFCVKEFEDDELRGTISLLHIVNTADTCSREKSLSIAPLFLI